MYMPNATHRVPNVNYIPLLVLGLGLGVQRCALDAQAVMVGVRGFVHVHEAI